MLEEIDNKKVKVSKFTLLPKGSTGFHVHALDYVIIPISDGKLKLINKNKKETYTTLKAGEPYFRKKGVEHNVINIGPKTITFIEVEIKDN
tara:strand:+ start:6105 stop:6377 length:273 start_codon:yes stop_codon:yes gene_type:complete